MSLKNQKKIMVIPKKKYVGFTLLELIIVIIIVAILAALGLPSFSGGREQVFGKEANSTLQIIAAAEKNYRMETGDFYPSSGTVSNIDAINQNLTLSLTETNWDYNITTGSGSGYSFFNITAYRNSTKTSAYYAGCYYWLYYNTSLTNNAENASRSDLGRCP